MRGLAVLSLLALPIAIPDAFAHPGGLNAEGCHNNRKTGITTAIVEVAVRAGTASFIVSGGSCQHLCKIFGAAHPN